MPHKLIFTDEAIDAAARLPSPAMIEAAARGAIDAVFGRGFRLRSYSERDVNVSVEFALPGGDGFIAYLVATDLWQVDTMAVPGRPRTVVLSDRAAALVGNMGWAIDAVERSARCAAICIGGERRFAGFSIPIESVDFRAALARDGSIEVDLIDLPALA